MIVRRFKVPAKANHTSSMLEAYSQILYTWVGLKAGEWIGWRCYNVNECEMELRKPGQKNQRSDVSACNRIWKKWFAGKI